MQVIRIREVLALTATITVCSHVSADKRVEAQSIEMDGWTFIPIVDDAGTPTTDDDTLHSFVALLDPSLVQGNQIAAILYAKDDEAEGGWRGAAWTTQDQWSVFGFMRDAYAISGDDADYWETTQPRPSIIESAPPPEPYRRGLFENDPLDEQVGPDDPARQAMVEVLVLAGYQAANLKIEEADLYADSALVLGALEYGVLAKRVDGLDPEAAANGQVVAGLGWCVPWTWTTYGAWTGTGSGPWTLIGSAGIGVPGSIPLSCKYQRTFTQTQTCSRLHRWFHCAYTTCFQSRTRTVVETATCDDPEQELSCPPQPVGNVTTVAASGEPTSWTPSCAWE